MTVGLIVNPKSGKNSGHGLKLVGLLDGQEGVDIKIIERFEQLPVFMAELAARDIDILFISSGDGTVQAIQTDIAESGRFKKQPHLCLLPHGTTNMTAADLGFGVKNVKAQADFIVSCAKGQRARDLRQRPTVRVANPADGHVRHGMFLGTGAAWQGTVFCQTNVHKTGLKGSWATFATLASALLKAAFLPANPQDKSRIDRAYDMRVRAGDETIASGGQLMFLTTTLEKLILGVKPFWGGRNGPLRATIIAYPPPNVFRWALPLMRGGEYRRVPSGAKSFCAELIEIETRCPFVIDGELFDPPEGEPLRIEAGPEFCYVCG